MYVGIPTRFGNFPAQWKTFWDSTGGLWVKQSLAGKMFGTFVSTGTPGGGQEITAFQSLSVAVHQGMVYVPLGYQVGDITNLDEVHGGSPWVCFLHPCFRVFSCLHVFLVVYMFSLAVCTYPRSSNDSDLPPQGAGTFAAGDGSRQPTALELRVAKAQGKLFAEYMIKHWQ
jgi:NAD(P)H dehydrogenase (quinone)